MWPLLFEPAPLTQTDHRPGEQAVGAPTSCALHPKLDPTGGRQCIAAGGPVCHLKEQSSFLL